MRESILPSRASSKKLKVDPVDILKGWMFMATDVTAQLSFGDSFHMLEKGHVCHFHANLLALHLIQGLDKQIHRKCHTLKPLSEL